jgi:hypothetical protein
VEALHAFDGRKNLISSGLGEVFEGEMDDRFRVSWVLGPLKMNRGAVTLTWMAFRAVWREQERVDAIRVRY